jgi:hypothetical protein
MPCLQSAGQFGWDIPGPPLPEENQKREVRLAAIMISGESGELDLGRSADACGPAIVGS